MRTLTILILSFAAGLSALAQTGVTLSVATPANGATVSSPVTINASASSSNTVTGWVIYVDGNTAWSTPGPTSSIAASVAMGPGAHTVVIRAWDSTGAFGSQWLWLSAGQAAVTVTSPLNGSTVSSPVVVQASGADLIAMAVYVDNNLALEVGGSTVNQAVTMTDGPHYVVVQGWEPDGSVIKTSLNVTASSQLSTTGGVVPFYASSSFWNTPILDNPPIDPNSWSMVNKALVAYQSSANFANSDAWGIGLAYAASADKLYTVLCTMYCTGDTITFPIPAGATPTSGSDHHLAVVNGAQELDMWEASYAATADTWSAGTRQVNDITGWGAACGLGQHCNGAVAAGFDLLGGVIRPEEMAQGHIDHALVLTTPYTRASYIACPATHTDGKYADVYALPEGARVQLDPSFNVDGQSWPQWEKVIAKALQKYGAYVGDTGGSVAVRGTTDVNGGESWSAAGAPKGPGLSNLPWSAFRVLQIQSCN